jgi:hypothetical protein
MCKASVTAVLIGLLTLTIWAGEAFAAGQIFTVRDVAVDESAGDAQEAKRVAIRVAQSVGWNRLVNAIVTGDASLVSEPDADTLQSMVQSVEFADEKITTGRYRALITVRFRSDSVLGWLEMSGVPHANAPTPTLLVLPVLDTGEGHVLWLEGGNPWLAAWQAYRDAGHAVPVVAPVADLDDLLAIDEAGALSGDWSAMQGLLSRYRADGVLVAVARSTDNGVEQTLTWYDGETGENVPVGTLGNQFSEEIADVVADGETVVIESIPVEDADDFASSRVGSGEFSEAVLQARTSVDNFWTVATLAPEGAEAVMVVEIPIRSLEEWVEIRSRLARPAVLSQSLPLVLGVDRVRVLLRYFGTLEQLRAGLRQVRLNLTAQGNTWLIVPL